MAGASHINLVGYQPSGSTTASPVWANGSTGYVQLLVATALEVVSASANDAAAGTGARTVRVDGVGTTEGTHVPFTETLTLNGTTPVPLVNTSAVAINRTTVLTAGSGLANAGKIDVRAVTGSLIKSSIQAVAEAINISQDFVYTIPASRYGLLKRIQVYARTNTGDLWAYLRTFNTGAVGCTQAVGQKSLEVTGFSDGQILMDFGIGLFIPEKTLITLITDVSAGTPLISAIGELELHVA